MRVSKIFVYGFALSLVVITPLLALTQDPSSDDEVRGAFLKSRQKAAATRRRSPSNPAPGGGKATPAPPTKPAESSEPVLPRTTAPAPPEAPLALGYTLYQRGPDGEPARVNPDQVFHSGAALRLTIEPNFDGYLYIFHTADDGPPKMLYPNSRLSRGENHVSAHRLYEVPSSREKDEEDQWLVICVLIAIDASGRQEILEYGFFVDPWTIVTGYPPYKEMKDKGAHISVIGANFGAYPANLLTVDKDQVKMFRPHFPLLSRISRTSSLRWPNVILNAFLSQIFSVVAPSSLNTTRRLRHIARFDRCGPVTAA